MNIIEKKPPKTWKSGNWLQEGEPYLKQMLKEVKCQRDALSPFAYIFMEVPVM